MPGFCRSQAQLGLSLPNLFPLEDRIGERPQTPQSFHVFNSGSATYSSENLGNFFKLFGKDTTIHNYKLY